MKQSTLVTKIAMLLLFAGVICYLAVAAWQSLFNPFTTVMAYSDTVDDSVKATGWLAREESVLPDGTGIVDIVPTEGERLGVGQTVAVLYKDEAAMERRQKIKALDLELQQLEYSLKQEDDTSQAGQLDGEIYSAMASLRTAAVSQNYSSVSDQTMLLKSLVFRCEYTGGGSSSDIDSLMQSVSSQVKSLQDNATQDTSDINVDQSGIYSSMVDGYETIFTPAALSGLTVSGLNALAAKQPAADTNSVGRLVTGSRWYFAALLSQTDAARLTAGGQVTVAFSHDYSGEISMQVESLSAPENGQVAAVFSSTRGLNDILLLRRQTVDIVFSSHAGIRVPKKALRVLSDGSQGVYVISGVTADFKKVDVLAEGDDFYLLSSAGGTDSGNALRAGDEVILTAKDIYDGKVVR